MIRRWGMFVCGKYTVEDMVETFDDSLGTMGFKREDSDDSTIILWKGYGGWVEVKTYTLGEVVMASISVTNLGLRATIESLLPSDDVSCISRGGED